MLSNSSTSVIVTGSKLSIFIIHYRPFSKCIPLSHYQVIIAIKEKNKCEWSNFSIQDFPLIQALILEIRKVL